MSSFPIENNMWIACHNRWHIVALGSFGNGKRPEGVCGARGISRLAHDRKPKRGIPCWRCPKIIEAHEQRKKKVVSDELRIYGKKAGENP